MRELTIHDRNRATCELCGDPLDTSREGVHQWTAGWVMLRSGGGGHGISLAERDAQRWAHGQCVRMAVDGTLHQGTLQL